MANVHSPPTQKRRGITMIELLVVISIIGTLTSLIFPAVQAARQSSRRNQCANNLKQLGLAVHSFSNSFNRLPNSQPLSAEGTPLPHSWMIYVMPYLEQQVLYDRYNFKKTWDDPANRQVAATRLTTLECSAVPTVGRFDFPPTPSTEAFAATTDYGAVTHVDTRLLTAALVDNATEGALPQKSQPTLAHISDGLATTLLIAESAGRPQVWRKSASFGALPTDRVNGGGWARPATDLALIGSTPDGITAPGPCGVNCTNGEPAGSVYPHPYYQTSGTGQFYSFHSGGINAAYADGSVHFINERVDIRMLARFVTRAGCDTAEAIDK